MAIRSKLPFRQISLIIAALFIIYLILIRPFWQEGRRVLDMEIEKKIKRANVLTREVGIIPSKESFEFLNMRQQRLKEAYELATSFINPPQPILPENVQDPGLFFVEKLHTATKKLERQAKAIGVVLPPNLGFSELMPDSARAPLLLRELELTETAVTSLLVNRLISLELLKPLEPVEVFDDSSGVVYFELLLQLSVRANTSQLIKFLSDVRNASPAIMVKEMQIKSGKDRGSEIIEADILLNSFMWK